jgi:hypothetical protein
MYQTNIIQNIITFNKAGFENAYNSLVAMHNKAQDFINDNIGKSPYIPDEGKKLVKSWFSLMTDTRDNVKNAVTEGQDKFAAIVNSVL